MLIEIIGYGDYFAEIILDLIRTGINQYDQNFFPKEKNEIKISDFSRKVLIRINREEKKATEGRHIRISKVGGEKVPILLDILETIADENTMKFSVLASCDCHRNGKISAHGLENPIKVLPLWTLLAQ